MVFIIIPIIFSVVNPTIIINNNNTMDENGTIFKICRLVNPALITIKLSFYIQFSSCNYSLFFHFTYTK